MSLAFTLASVSTLVVTTMEHAAWGNAIALPHGLVINAKYRAVQAVAQVMAAALMVNASVLMDGWVLTAPQRHAPTTALAKVNATMALVSAQPDSLVPPAKHCAALTMGATLGANASVMKVTRALIAKRPNV